MSQAAPETAEISAPAPRGHQRPLVARLMLAVTVVLGLWIGWLEAPREVGRWYLAAAAEHRVNGEYFRVLRRSNDAEVELRQAETLLEKSLAWNPQDGVTFLERAKWRAADARYEEALADCETAASLGTSELAVARVKLAVLTPLGKSSEAVEEALKLDAHARRTWTAKDDPLTLNGVAYFRALARQELPQALTEIETALKQLPKKYQRLVLLDTRGFVLYQMGRYQEALADFEVAVPLADDEVAIRQLAPNLYSIPEMDFRDFKIKEPRERASLAVIYYHSSLVFQRLNRWKEAQQHLRKAKELLGRTPDESVF